MFLGRAARAPPDRCRARPGVALTDLSVRKYKRENNPEQGSGDNSVRRTEGRSGAAASKLRQRVEVLGDRVLARLALVLPSVAGWGAPRSAYQLRHLSSVWVGLRQSRTHTLVGLRFFPTRRANVARSESALPQLGMDGRGAAPRVASPPTAL